MPAGTQAERLPGAVSHNLLGQKLGRKGLQTRERILAAALRLLEDGPGGGPLTLSTVAREASVGMTTLYLYFPDLGELVLAASHRVAARADEAYLGQLLVYWPDDELETRCVDFLLDHFRFWQRHGRVLQIRNSFVDANDERFLECRQQTTYPLLDALICQMGADPAEEDSACRRLAILLVTGFERLAMMMTSPNFLATSSGPETGDYVERLIRSEADLVALAIRDKRARSARAA